MWFEIPNHNRPTNVDVTITYHSRIVFELYRVNDTLGFEAMNVKLSDCAGVVQPSDGKSIDTNSIVSIFEYKYIWRDRNVSSAAGMIERITWIISII